MNICIKGSASQLYNLVLKALIYKNSVVLIFFPTFKKPLHELCQQPLVVRNRSLELATALGRHALVGISNRLWFAISRGIS